MTWQTALSRIASDAAWQAEVTERITRQLHDEVPELRENAGLVEETKASTADNVRLFGLVASGRADASEERLPPMAAAYARTMVRRGISSGTVLLIYRIAHAVAWRSWVERIRQEVDEPAAFADALEYAADLLLAFINAVSEAVRREYERESESASSGASHRSRTVALVLDGSESDATWIGRRLRYDVQRTHTAVVAWAAEPGGETTRDPAAAQQALGRLLAPATSTLIVGLPGQIVAAWTHRFTAEAPLPLDPAAIERSGLQLAVGTPLPGLAGFRQSHREAREARRVGLLAGDRGGSVTTYADVAAVALATAQIDDARAFVQRQLGGLLAPTPQGRRLMRTLLVYLEHRGRASAAADELGVHVNTVVNHVRAAERLLPRLPDRRTSDTLIALRVAQRIG